MRVEKKPHVVEVKRTRSCVVRLEKVLTNSPNVSPSPEEIRSTKRKSSLSTTTMGTTAKGRKGGISSQQESKGQSGTAKRKVGSNISANAHSSVRTQPPPQQQQKGTNKNMPNIRTSQKVKMVPRSNKATAVSTPSIDETPPPTIAAGRSRRAIKPNPKYASEDMVTPKVVRNVGNMASTSSIGGAATAQGKSRKASTSSDDFYNRNSEDEYENKTNKVGNKSDTDDEDLRNDKAYHESEKDDQDSDFSIIEEAPVRTARSRTRSKKAPESTTQAVLTPQTYSKLQTQTPNVKRTSTTTLENSNIRSAPSQLQQIRRSLASANAQRNLNLLAARGAANAQKRKLEEVQDSSDNETGYSIKRKQLLLSNSSGLKVKVPVRENRVNLTSALLAKSRLSTHTQVYKAQLPQQQQTINGSSKINYSQTTSRRAIEIAAKSNTESVVKTTSKQPTNVTNSHQNVKTQNQNPLTTQAKIVASKALRIRSGSPKLPTQKERQNNGASISVSSSSSGSTSSLNAINKTIDRAKVLTTQSTLKSKAITPSPSHNSGTINSENKDDSPNSTMDDFETMPTFTIVNVNDIINKKGDVLITKSKSNSNKSPTVIEFSESISLDDDDDDDEDNDDVEEVEEVDPVQIREKQVLAKKPQKLATLNSRKQFENKRNELTRANNLSRKLPTQPTNSSSSSNQQSPQILNHKLGLRSTRVTAKTTTTLTATLNSPDKPAPRILNSVVAKKTQPVKPMIANMDDSADESFPLSLDEDDDEDNEQDSENEIENRNQNLVHMTDKPIKRGIYRNLVEVDTEDTESQNTEEDDAHLHATNSAATNRSANNFAALTPKQNIPQQRRRGPPVVSSNPPFIVSSNKKRMTPAAAKENSLAAINKQVNNSDTKQHKVPTLPLPPRKLNTEKIVISKQGDKIIKKITCFETWYVINTPVDAKRPAAMKNQLEMPLIRLANQVKNICLPNSHWNYKVNLYELSSQTLLKSTFETYTGDLFEHNISEVDRGKYQPSCVMFRRSIEKNQLSRMPYDRAVIFKNKTFYTNIEGKNVRLLGAPSIINSESEIEILLQIVDNLTLQSDFVEHISIAQ